MSLIKEVSYQVQENEAVESMLENAGLNWTVETSPYSYGAFNQFTSDSVVGFRSDNGKSFGEYKERTPRQNHEIVTLFKRFLEVGGLSITGVGSLNGGSEIFAYADLPIDTHGIVIDRNVNDIGKREADVIAASLMIKESHIAGVGTQIFLFTNRLICTNGATTKVKTQVGSLHHKGSIDYSTVQSVLQSAVSGLKLKRNLLNQLATVTMSKDEAVKQLITAFGDPAKEWDDQPDLVKNVFHLFCGEAIGSNFSHCFETAYQLLQSLTDYQSNRARSESQANRFSSILNGDYAKQARKLEAQLVSCFVS